MTLASKLLKLESASFLSILRKHPSLKREKHQGRYVYFSADQQVYVRQREQKLKLIRDSKMPSEMEAVLILAEIIKHPDWDINRIAASLKKQKYPVTPQMIQNLLAPPTVSFEPEQVVCTQCDSDLKVRKTSMLIEWILDGKNRGHGYGFPFDRVHAVFTHPC